MVKILTALTFLVMGNAYAVLKFTFIGTDVSTPPATWPAGFNSKSIALEATQFISGDMIGFGMDFALNAGDKIVLTVNNGATFANNDYSLEWSAGGAGTGDLSYGVLQGAPVNGDTSITFVTQESINPTALADARLFILSGDVIAGQASTFNLPGAPGVDISIKVEVFTAGDVLIASSGNYLMFESSLAAASASPLEW